MFLVLWVIKYVQEMASELGLPYYETSAATGEGKRKQSYLFSHKQMPLKIGLIEYTRWGWAVPSSGPAVASYASCKQEETEG